MRIIITIGLFLWGNIYAYNQSQELDKLIKTKLGLIKLRDQLADSIKKVDIRINFLQNQNKPAENIKIEFSNAKTKSEAIIKNKPSPFGDVIGKIPAEQTVKVYDFISGYFLIEKDSLRGYTSDMYLYINSKLATLIQNQNKNEIIKKYGEETANRILAHQIWLGMTSDMATLSIGRPLEINRTVISGMTHEQWVYDGRYLYFENGLLTAYQD